MEAGGLLTRSSDYDAMTDEPIDDGELPLLFRSFLKHERILLAVSGGRDSIALLVLAARWVETLKPSGTSPELIVATVDHRLRAAAEDEAALVAVAAARLGLSHAILRVSETPPSTGLQAWARAQRYALLINKAKASGGTAIATGHQAEDQAETVLMRLARGSGLDGLAGMTETGHRADVAILRPLLGMPRARLTATLIDGRWNWTDDPSNKDPRFERTLFQHHGKALSALGLEPGPIGLSARRLNDARTALDWAVQSVLADMPDCLAALKHAAYSVMPRQQFSALPVELRRRLLGCIMSFVSGQSDPTRLDRLEALIDRLAAQTPEQPVATFTLSGCIVEQSSSQISFYREPGRDGFPVLSVSPGEAALWDGRFQVSVPACFDRPLEVRAYSDQPVNSVASELPADQLKSLPVAARAAIPAFWDGDTLIAVPQIGHVVAGLRMKVKPPEFAENPPVNRQKAEDDALRAYPRDFNIAERHPTCEENGAGDG